MTRKRFHTRLACRRMNGRESSPAPALSCQLPSTFHLNKALPFFQRAHSRPLASSSLEILLVFGKEGPKKADGKLNFGPVALQSQTLRTSRAKRHHQAGQT